MSSVSKVTVHGLDDRGWIQISQYVQIFKCDTIKSMFVTHTVLTRNAGKALLVMTTLHIISLHLRQTEILTFGLVQVQSTSCWCKERLLIVQLTAQRLQTSLVRQTTLRYDDWCQIASSGFKTLIFPQLLFLSLLLHSFFHLAIFVSYVFRLMSFFIF